MTKESDLMIIQEEYKIWRKNVPFLYDMVYTETLDFPSPSVQWFPEAQRIENRMTAQRLLLTTYTRKEENERLLISQVTFPDTVDDDAVSNANIQFKVTQSIPIKIDANKVRICPLATNIIACKTDAPEILIYDYTSHPSSGSTRGADTELKGHKEGGFALAWNPHVFGELSSGGRDKLLNIFDINKGLKRTINRHSGILNDISYSGTDPFVLCTVSDDMNLIVHDLRSDQKTLILDQAHHSTIESCEFSPFKSDLIVTGSSDSSAKVWDIRKPTVPIVTLRGHKDTVIATKWSPHYESILASSSGDRRVIIWDLNKSNKQTADEVPEMFFVHGGHMSTVDDIDWNPAEPLEIASVSNDGILNIWKIPFLEYL